MHIKDLLVRKTTIGAAYALLVDKNLEWSDDLEAIKPWLIGYLHNSLNDNLEQDFAYSLAKQLLADTNG
jgi:hypothetical protein